MHSMPTTAENAEYFSTIANFDYRIHPNWNVYVKGAYETASVYKANGIFEKGLYRTTWNAQACVEYFPMRNRELLIFAHMLYKGHHLTERAKGLGHNGKEDVAGHRLPERPTKYSKYIPFSYPDSRRKQDKRLGFQL